MSTVLGCYARDDALYGSAVTRERGGLCVVEGFYEAPCTEASLGVALGQLVSASGVRSIAWALAPEAAFIEPFPQASFLMAHQRRAAARSYAEVEGFGPQDPVYAIATPTGHYIAAGRAELLDRLAAAARAAKARLVWAEAEAYAWARVLPDDAEAFVSFGAYNVRAVAVGEEAAWCRLVPRDKVDADVLGDVCAYLTQLELDGMVAIRRILVDGDVPAVARVLGARNKLWEFSPFTFTLGSEHVRWACATGIAWSALLE